MEIHTHAKINLALDILGRLDNGYHQVKMVMQSVALHDTLTVTPADAGITLTTDSPEIPCDASNLAHRAAVLFYESTGIAPGVHIHIQKRIPVSAGLAGGSSNAAGVLRALDLMHDTKLSDDALSGLGAHLGADVPFCLLTGTALAQGLGTELSPLPAFPRLPVLLVKPDIAVSTAWAYHNFDLANADKLNVDDIASHIGDAAYVAAHMGNALETVTEREYPVIAHIKQKMRDCGALGAMMSGSGPTVFGLFPDIRTAEHALRAFESEPYFSTITQTVCEIENALPNEIPVKINCAVIV